MTARQQTYLGNGVYVELRFGELVLFTSDGNIRSNEIIVSYGMLQLALAFINRTTGKEVK